MANSGQYLRRSEETQAKLLFLSYAYVKLNYQDSKGPFKRIECRRGINLSSGGPTDFNMFVASISWWCSGLLIYTLVLVWISKHLGALRVWRIMNWAVSF